MNFLKILFLLSTFLFWQIQPLLAMEDLDQRMRGLSLAQPSPSNIIREGFNSNRYTHTPRNGNTLYITDEATVSFQTKEKQLKMKIIPSSAKDLCARLNHNLYFINGLGGRSNHLFVSLGITFKKIGEAQIKRKVCPLTWNQDTQEFAFSPSTPMDPHTCYVDFYNHARENWEEGVPREIEDKKVKLVFCASEGIPGVVPANVTHSEPKSLGLLSSQKHLIVDAINRLPSPSKIKVIQLFFHSFLDFCADCEHMISQFQRNFRGELLPYLQAHLSPNHFLFSKKGHKPDRVIFMTTGINNRLYRMKPYFYNQENDEKNHTYSGYFLESYQPYTGEFLWRQTPHQDFRLVTYINEPIGQGVQVNSPFGDLSLMMPLDRVTLYWRLRAHHLYWDLEDFRQLISPHLLMIDLKDARLGIREDEDDGDCCTASQGNELTEAIEAIQPCLELRHLNLSGNWLESRSHTLSFLPPLFNSFQKLIYLNLSNCYLNSENAVRTASQILGFLPHLEHLDLSHNGFNADTFLPLQSGLAGLSRLVTLNLSYNRLAHGYDFESDYKGSAEADTTEALEWIIDYIYGTPSLVEVDLTDNDFDSISFFWSEIKDNTGLQREALNKVRAKLCLEETDGQEDSDSFTSSSEEEEGEENESGSSEEEESD